jgi:NAD(P)H-dependent FMN reductase
MTSEGEPVHPAVGDLRAQIAAADALLLCTPEYAGALTPLVRHARTRDADEPR